MTYPESHVKEIRRAVEENDEKAAADAALFLLAAFLVDVRRIADALQSLASRHGAMKITTPPGS